MNCLKDLEYLKDKLKKANITYKTEPLDNIETALKRLEEIDNSVKPDMEYYEKRSQALEIIKEKRVNVGILMFYVRTQDIIETLKAYNHYILCNGIGEVLALQEYNLLKEVML